MSNLAQPPGRHSRPVSDGYVTWCSGDLTPDLPRPILSVPPVSASAPVEFAVPTPELCIALLVGLRRLP